MKNFIDYKFARGNDTKRYIAEKITKVILYGINNFQFAEPKTASAPKLDNYELIYLRFVFILQSVFSKFFFFFII